jgi:hypothetical protein
MGEGAVLIFFLHKVLQLFGCNRLFAVDNGEGFSYNARSVREPSLFFYPTPSMEGRYDGNGEQRAFQVHPGTYARDGRSVAAPE